MIYFLFLYLTNLINWIHDKIIKKKVVIILVVFEKIKNNKNKITEMKYIIPL